MVQFSHFSTSVDTLVKVFMCGVLMDVHVHQPAIHSVKGISIVGNVVEGVRPTQTMDNVPSKMASRTLLWSRTIVFRVSQN